MSARTEADGLSNLSARSYQTINDSQIHTSSSYSTGERSFKKPSRFLQLSTESLSPPANGISISKNHPNCPNQTYNYSSMPALPSKSSLSSTSAMGKSTSEAAFLTLSLMTQTCSSRSSASPISSEEARLGLESRPNSMSISSRCKLANSKDMMDFPVGVSPTTQSADAPVFSSQSSQFLLKWDYGADLATSRYAYSQGTADVFTKVNNAPQIEEEKVAFYEKERQTNTENGYDDDTDGIWTWPACQQSNFTKMPQLISLSGGKGRDQASDSFLILKNNRDDHETSPSTQIEKQCQINFVESPDLIDVAHASFWSLPRFKQQNLEKHTFVEPRPPHRSASLTNNFTNIQLRNISQSIQVPDSYPCLQDQQQINGSQDLATSLGGDILFETDNESLDFSQARLAATNTITTNSNNRNNVRAVSPIPSYTSHRRHRSKKVVRSQPNIDTEFLNATRSCGELLTAKTEAGLCEAETKTQRSINGLREHAKNVLKATEAAEMELRLRLESLRRVLSADSSFVQQHNLLTTMDENGRPASSGSSTSSTTQEVCRPDQVDDDDNNDDISNLDFNSSAAASECPSYHHDGDGHLRRHSALFSLPFSAPTVDPETITKVTAVSISEATDNVTSIDERPITPPGKQRLPPSNLHSTPRPNQLIPRRTRYFPSNENEIRKRLSLSCEDHRERDTLIAANTAEETKIQSQYDLTGETERAIRVIKKAHHDFKKLQHGDPETNRYRALNSHPSLYLEAMDDTPRHVFKHKNKPSDVDKNPRFSVGKFDMNTNGDDKSPHKRMVDVKVWIQNKTRQMSLRPSTPNCERQSFASASTCPKLEIPTCSLSSSQPANCIENSLSTSYAQYMANLCDEEPLHPAEYECTQDTSCTQNSPDPTSSTDCPIQIYVTHSGKKSQPLEERPPLNICPDKMKQKRCQKKQMVSCLRAAETISEDITPPIQHHFPSESRGTQPCPAMPCYNDDKVKQHQCEKKTMTYDPCFDRCDKSLKRPLSINDYHTKLKCQPCPVQTSKTCDDWMKEILCQKQKQISEQNADIPSAKVSVKELPQEHRNSIQSQNLDHQAVSSNSDKESDQSNKAIGEGKLGAGSTELVDAQIPVDTLNVPPKPSHSLDSDHPQSFEINIELTQEEPVNPSMDYSADMEKRSAKVLKETTESETPVDLHQHIYRQCEPDDVLEKSKDNAFIEDPVMNRHLSQHSNLIDYSVLPTDVGCNETAEQSKDKNYTEVKTQPRCSSQTPCAPPTSASCEDNSEVDCIQLNDKLKQLVRDEVQKLKLAKQVYQRKKQTLRGLQILLANECDPCNMASFQCSSISSVTAVEHSMLPNNDGKILQNYLEAPTRRQRSSDDVECHDAALCCNEHKDLYKSKSPPNAIVKSNYPKSPEFDMSAVYTQFIATFDTKRKSSSDLVNPSHEPFRRAFDRDHGSRVRPTSLSPPFAAKQCRPAPVENDCMRQCGRDSSLDKFEHRPRSCLHPVVGREIGQGQMCQRQVVEQQLGVVIEDISKANIEAALRDRQLCCKCHRLESPTPPETILRTARASSGGCSWYQPLPKNQRFNQAYTFAQCKSLEREHRRQGNIYWNTCCENNRNVMKLSDDGSIGLQAASRPPPEDLSKQCIFQEDNQFNSSNIDKIEAKSELQKAFQLKMQDFVNRSRKRQEWLRIYANNQRLAKEKANNDQGNNSGKTHALRGIPIRSSSMPGHPVLTSWHPNIASNEERKARQRVISPQTRKLIAKQKSLFLEPHVQHRLLREQYMSNLKSNRIKMKLFSDTIRRKLLKKTTILA